MQHSEPSRGDVIRAPEWIVQTPPRRRGEGDRHGIDGEITAAEIFVDTGRAHVGKRARSRVSLAAGRGDIHTPHASAVVGSPAFERGRAEGAVDHEMPAHLLGEPPAEGDAVPFDHEVEVGDMVGGAPEQEIAHEAARSIRGMPLRLAEFARGAEQPEPGFALGAVESLEPRGERALGTRRCFDGA
jgi:hypothetical protein